MAINFSSVFYKLEFDRSLGVFGYSRSKILMYLMHKDEKGKNNYLRV